MNIHFIGGLPRSGSTLLSAILSQNPTLTAGIRSPVYDIFSSAINTMGNNTTLSVFFDDKKRIAILRGIFNGYYDDVESNHIILDTNRGWQSCTPAITSIFPNCKFIFMVRDIVDVYSSFERLFRRNPFSAAFSTPDLQARSRQTVYDRIQQLSAPDGAVGFAYRGLSEACFSQYANRVLLVEYGAFVANPRSAIKQIYKHLDIPYFPHDFNNLAFSGGDEFDKRIGLIGMHKVLPKVQTIDHETVLPPDLIEQFFGMEFWRKKTSALAHVQIFQ